MKNRTMILFLLPFLVSCANEQEPPPPSVGEESTITKPLSTTTEKDESSSKQKPNVISLRSPRGTISIDEAEQRVRSEIDKNNKQQHVVLFDHIENGRYVIQVYESTPIEKHVLLYSVDPLTGVVEEWKN